MKTLKELQISRRSVVKGALLSLGYSLFGETAFGASLSKYNVVLGRPTNNSIAISLISGTPLSAYIEYGYKPTSLVKKSPVTTFATLSPKTIELAGLNPNSQVFYRVRSKAAGASAYEVGQILTFSTARKAVSYTHLTLPTILRV